MIKVHQHALINQMLYQKKMSAAGRLVITLRKKKTYLTNKKNAPNVFLN